MCKHNVIVACVFETETLLARRRLQTEPHQHNWGGVAKRLRQEPAKLQAVVRVHSPLPVLAFTEM